jgi:REase_DpnII-MboI
MAERSNGHSATANTLGGLAALSANLQAVSSLPTPGVAPVLLAMQEFDACIRYLNTRRSAGAIINIESEADVQDVLYLLLRPWIIDLNYESPADKTANRFAIKDFASPSGRFVIDAKYIRNKDHGKNISKELHDDIEMYRTHPRCDDLIFFVYDPNLFIPDQRALRGAIEVARFYGDGSEKRLNCHLIVK